MDSVRYYLSTDCPIPCIVKTEKFKALEYDRKLHDWRESRAYDGLFYGGSVCFDFDEVDKDTAMKYVEQLNNMNQ